MPGSVANAIAVTVLPDSLSTAFVEIREWIVLANDYRNGESQRRALTATSRKRFRLSKRITRTQLEALRAFYDARSGPLEAFYFYHLWETVPLFSHDPTGAATVGRYTVRFEGEWNQSAGLGRSDASIELLELA